MTDSDQPVLLLTPGPLTTSASTRAAMDRDWGSRNSDFIELTARVRDRLRVLSGGSETYTCVPLQGPGTFAIEALLGTVVPPDGGLLVLVNGAYGARMAAICERLGRPHMILKTAEDTPPRAEEVADFLRDHPDISHVAAVHCETTSGILNPIEEIAEAAADAGRCFILDAMSSFGALPLDVDELSCGAVVASANKCLEGVPGLGFVIIRERVLEVTAGRAPSISLDLYEQWKGLEANGQWRFTPPTHVLAALDQALDEHAAEGGTEGRGARYGENCRTLVEGMRALGFETLLPDALQAPIIVTFHAPADHNYHFTAFLEALGRRGIVIYPGKLTQADSFRIGCIGRVDKADMERAVSAVAGVAEELGIVRRGREA